MTVRRTPRAIGYVITVLALLVAAAAFGIGQRDGAAPAEAAQTTSAVWNSGMVWAPSLQETGDALAGLVNEINAACVVDVDPTVATNGAAVDGTVYALAVTWSCPPGTAQGSGGTWQSAMLWRPTLPETGDALAELVNQIDASCIVDVDRVVATNGAGPEGPVYAYAITWACPAAAAGG